MALEEVKNIIIIIHSLPVIYQRCTFYNVKYGMTRERKKSRNYTIRVNEDVQSKHLFPLHTSIPKKNKRIYVFIEKHYQPLAEFWNSVVTGQ